MNALYRNTILLTASSLSMQIIGLIFQIWLIGRIGASGIGLFQLVMSVGSFCSTVAISGIRFASTRLISEEIGLDRDSGIGPAMKRCLAYSSLFGLLSCLALYFFSEPIGFMWIGDARTVRCLKALSFSLPFMSLSSVFAGYFTAVGRVYKSALIQILEQLFRIALVIILLSRIESGNIEKACYAVCISGTVAEILGFAMFLIIYIFDKYLHYSVKGKSEQLTSRMLRIALPLAVSAYARTSLTTLQHLLVPRALRQSGHSADSALAGYGTVNGMVFPVIMFPCCVLTSLAELLVPDLTEAQVSGRQDYISETVGKLLMRSLIFSAGCAVFLYSVSDALAMLIYSSSTAGHYIRLFVPLIPIMYIDIVTDGCLKGLGLMMWSMTVNVIDSLCGVILVVFLVPRFGLAGYIIVIYITEIINFILSVIKLFEAAGPRFVLKKKNPYA